MKVLLFFLLITNITSLLAAEGEAESLSVGLIDTGRPPYFWFEDQGRVIKGLYIDLMEAISKDSGIVFSYERVPHARIRLHMKHNLLDVEPGIDKGWRTDLDEVGMTVYSEPFMESEEVYVFSAERFRKAPAADERTNLNLCKILGFNEFSDTKKFSLEQKLAVSSEVQILNLLKLQRCDYALFPVLVLDFLENEVVFEKVRSDVIAVYNLRFRINEKKKHLLPKINEALNKLKNNGEIELIIEKYRRGG